MCQGIFPLRPQFIAHLGVVAVRRAYSALLSLIPVAHEDTDDIETLSLQQQRRYARVDAAGHGDGDALRRHGSRARTHAPAETEIGRGWCVSHAGDDIIHSFVQKWLFCTGKCERDYRA